uniref:HD domain-containing protein n=1 Tax=Candidatus Caldatribacterium californiense TaxID=1454726 RepID=A0A7V4DG88_9BACT
MNDLERLAERFDQEVIPSLKRAWDVQADTRIPGVSLYDHLVLTAGFAVAMVEELCLRGKTPEEICGLPLSREELRTLARLGGLFHDLGKARIGKTEYRFHVERGMEYAENLLNAWCVTGEIRDVLLDVIGRHHLDDGPVSALEKVVCLADSMASAGDRPELARAETREEFERVAERTFKLEEELFGKEPPLVFLMADVDAIKSYVYETSNLSEIRGGSEILVEVEQEIAEEFRRELARECLIYCGGGNLLAVLPVRQARDWDRKIERLYLEKTRVATATVVTSPPVGYREIARGLFPHDDASVRKLSGEGIAGDLLFSHFEALVEDRGKRKNFGELVARLSGDLQRKKQKKLHAPFFETLPIQVRCMSCGRRAAEREELDELICGVCGAKRDWGRKEKRGFVERFAGFLEEQEGIKSRPKPPKDLEELVGGEEGQIALLYADGNNMGDILQQATSPAFYRNFSEALRMATEEALFRAFVQTFGREAFEEERRILPFEIVTLGGDDIVVLVPARASWKLALNLLRNFEGHEGILRIQEIAGERLGKALRLSMSLGLAIADEKYPVSFLLGLAESLLKRAKSLARKTQKNTICHLWLRAPVLIEDGGRLLDTLYRKADRGCTLTLRPYTLDQAVRLAEIAAELAVLPSSQLRDFAEVLEQGVRVSLNFALYQVARMGEERRERVIRLFRDLGRLPEEGESCFFWVKRNGSWFTGLLDAVELVELGASGVSLGEEGSRVSASR